MNGTPGSSSGFRLPPPPGNPALSRIREHARHGLAGVDHAAAPQGDHQVASFRAGEPGRLIHQVSGGFPAHVEDHRADASVAQPFGQPLAPRLERSQDHEGRRPRSRARAGICCDVPRPKRMRPAVANSNIMGVPLRGRPSRTSRWIADGHHVGHGLGPLPVMRRLLVGCRGIGGAVDLDQQEPSGIVLLLQHVEPAMPGSCRLFREFSTQAALKAST